MQNEIILKGMGFKNQDNGKFYAVCLTTSHIATGKDSEEALKKLLDQVQDYLRLIHEEKGADLTFKDVRRRAPWFYWQKYYLFHIIHFFIEIANLANDSVRFFESPVDPRNAHLKAA